jgi:shikimate kinase
MGSGKTTLGRKLANKLDYDFIDLDELIEEQEKLGISEIFSKQGEDSFRKTENRILNETLTTKKNIVLSVGGGTPCYFNNMELINKQATSIYLKYNVGMLFSRLISAKTKRPLIAKKSDEELKDFIQKTLLEREEFYNKSNIIVAGNNITTELILHQLDLK